MRETRQWRRFVLFDPSKFYNLWPFSRFNVCSGWSILFCNKVYVIIIIRLYPLHLQLFYPSPNPCYITDVISPNNYFIAYFRSKTVQPHALSRSPSFRRQQPQKPSPCLCTGCVVCSGVVAGHDIYRVAYEPRCGQRAQEVTCRHVDWVARVHVHRFLPVPRWLFAEVE